MVVSNKRLTRGPVSGFKLIYPGCAIHPACKAHVSFKMERGSYVGQGRGEQEGGGEGPSGFCFSGEPFKH